MTDISIWRRAAALLLSCGVLAAGVAAVLLAGDGARVFGAPTSYPWWLLALLYIPLCHYSIDFEFGNEARSFGFTHLPFALGIAFVSPLGHLAARLIGSIVDAVFLRRQPPVKVAFNVATGAAELGIASLALATISRIDAPGPALWLVLLMTAFVAEMTAQLQLAAIMRLLGIRMPPGHLRGPLAAAALTAPIATGLSVVAVAAIWTQPFSAIVLAVLIIGLTFGYRSHRRLAAQQQSTAELYAFVKHLGPVDAEAPAAANVVEEVRLLLHARHLDLALIGREGQGWRHLTAHDGGAEGDFTPLAPDDAGVSAGAVQTADRMSVPLLGAHGFLGLLTVSQRLGSVRDFDLGDLRLIETVGTELATALEQGRLLRDLARTATTDSVTGLPNISETTRRLEELIAASPAGVVLAAIAVESFREVNDTLGHQVGDDLLREVTRRLKLSFPDAVLGRIGGGRFAAAVPMRGDDGGGAELFGLSIRAQVEGGAQLGAVGTHVRLSVGIVRSPEHGLEGATLLRRAETAMYGARHAHGGPLVWEPLYEVEGQRRLAVVTALREAISNGSVGVAYQPKVRLSDRSVSGVEALARWIHPALGAISPEEFIPLAEAAGLMGPLTTNVMRQALTACLGWQRRGGTGVGVAVNVSADTVLHPDFITEVAALLTSAGASPDLLTVELTESVLVSDPLLAIERMGELRALGVKISMDDFGTGYSSLTYLRGLPVDEVKIDKSFIDALDTDPANAAIVRAVVDIAHTLGLRVIAEGIEHEEQNEHLRVLGVDEAQGYLHARPMPALETASWLRRREAARQ